MSNRVPERWSVSTIGDTCDVLDSKRIPLNSQDRALRQGIYPYYGANGIQGYIDDFIFEGEHVLLAEDGGYFDEWDSRPISYLVTGRFWVNNHAHILRARPGHETRYVHYSLVHKNILRHINGGTRAKLNQSDMREIPYLTPPLPEQQKIAAILSSVDDVIEKTRAQIDKLKNLKTGMMQELLTKGVGHVEFKDSPVGRIPVSWKIQSLKSLCRRITDGTHQSVKTSDSGKIPFLYVSCIRNGEILWDKAAGLTESEYKLASKGRVASPGDILFTAVGSYGHAALVETDQRFSFQRHIAFIQPDKSTVDPRFLVSVLNSTLGRKQANRFAIGNAQLTVTLGDLGTFMIPTPPLHEQHKIANTISAIVSNIHEHETKLDSSLNLKKALMQDLLTGKVRVNVTEKATAVA